MNVYATNKPEQGYQLQGAWESLEEAQRWALERGLQFAHWATEEALPEWANWPIEN